MAEGHLTLTGTAKSHTPLLLPLLLLPTPIQLLLVVATMIITLPPSPLITLLLPPLPPPVVSPRPVILLFIVSLLSSRGLKNLLLALHPLAMTIRLRPTAATLPQLLPPLLLAMLPTIPPLIAVVRTHTMLNGTVAPQSLLVPPIPHGTSLFDPRILPETGMLVAVVAGVLRATRTPIILATPLRPNTCLLPLLHMRIVAAVMTDVMSVVLRIDVVKSVTLPRMPLAIMSAMSRLRVIAAAMLSLADVDRLSSELQLLLPRPELLMLLRTTSSLFPVPFLALTPLLRLQKVPS